MLKTNNQINNENYEIKKKEKVSKKLPLYPGGPRAPFSPGIP